MCSCVKEANQVNMLMEYIKIFAPVIGAFIIAVVGAILAYRYGVKKLRIETKVALERKKYELILESLQECWKLFAYTTDVENEKSIITYVKTKNETTYFINKHNASEFIKLLSAYFYNSGLGLYLPKPVKPLLFEYRGLIYGLLLSLKNNDSENIKIENIELANKLKQLHNSLILVIREEMDNVQIN